MAKIGGLGMGRGLDALMGSSANANLTTNKETENTKSSVETSYDLPKGVEADKDGAIIAVRMLYILNILRLVIITLNRWTSILNPARCGSYHKTQQSQQTV